MVSELLSFKAWDMKRRILGEDVKIRIEKFDRTNFGFWRMQIENYLHGKKLSLPLLG